MSNLTTSFGADPSSLSLRVLSANSSPVVIGSVPLIYTLFCNSILTNFSVTLPVPKAGQQVYIKDSGNNAANNNIVILPHASETIDAASSYTISSNLGWVLLESDGTNWFVVSATSGASNFLCSYYLSSTFSGTGVVTFDTKIVDPGTNIVNGVFTAPVAGNYNFQFIGLVTGGAGSCVLYKNGSFYGGFVNALAGFTPASMTLPLIPSDTVSVYNANSISWAGGTPNSNGSYLTVTRKG